MSIRMGLAALIAALFAATRSVAVDADLQRRCVREAPRSAGRLAPARTDLLDHPVHRSHHVPGLTDLHIVVGQKVRVGQTLLIIEAMKTLNQIPSPLA